MFYFVGIMQIVFLIRDIYFEVNDHVMFKTVI